MMVKKCYEMKKCPFYLNESKMESNCPVYDLKISCWEFNWKGFYDKMPHSKDKENWRCGMIEHCKKCDVYYSNKAEMDLKLVDLRK